MTTFLERRIGVNGYRGGLRERQRRQREEAILTAAFELIVEKGYEAMTMDDLAERVGISKPTLYHHFSSKEAITVRTLVALNEKTVESIEAIDIDMSPLQRLETVIRWLVRSRFSPERAAILRARWTLGPAKVHPDYVRAAERRTDALARIISAAQDAGDIDAATPARLLTYHLFSSICAPEYDEMVLRGDISPEALEETLVGMFLNGVRTTKSR